MTRRIRFLLSLMCVGMVVLGTVGCSSNEEESAGPKYSIPDQPRPEIRAEYRGFVKNADALYNYSERYIKKCMAKAGFDYEEDFVKADEPQHYVVDETDVISVAEVQKNHGYPPDPVNPEGGGDVENAGYMRTPVSKRDAWDTALSGVAKTDEEALSETPAPGVFGIRGQKGGCRNEADAEQYGDLTRADQVQILDSNLPLRAFNAAYDDPEMVNLNKKWQSCMKDKGFRRTNGGEKLERPSLAQVLAFDQPDRAFDIAMADATCQESLDYGKKRTFIEDRYLTGVADYYEGQIQGALEIQKEALERSKREFG